MNDGCGERRMALGAYVLDALQPVERAEIEAHLAGCAGCREELAGLVGLPAMLGRLSAEEAVAAGSGVGAGAGAGAVPAPGLRVGSAAGSRPTLVERTIAELRERRRRQRLRWRVGVATGGAAVIALAAAVGVLGVTRPAPTAPVVAAVARLSGVDRSTGVRASAELYAEAWGRLRGHPRRPVRAGGDRAGRLPAGGGDLEGRVHRWGGDRRGHRDQPRPALVAADRHHLGLGAGGAPGLRRAAPMTAGPPPRPPTGLRFPSSFRPPTAASRGRGDSTGRRLPSDNLNAGLAQLRDGLALPALGRLPPTSGRTPRPATRATRSGRR